MTEYDKLKKLIKTSFDYEMVCDAVDKYLEETDPKFLNNYQNMSIIYIDLVKEKTMAVIFMLAGRLGKTRLISEEYKKYDDMQTYILKNYTLALKEIADYCEKDGIEDFGLGFIYFDHKFEEPSVLKFFADHFLTDLFALDDSKFLASVIKKFPEKEKLKTYGLKKCMIKYISLYDNELANYVIANQELLVTYSKKIDIDELYNNKDELENSKLKFIYDSNLEMAFERSKLLKKFSKLISPEVKNQINTMAQQLNVDLKAEELYYYYLFRKGTSFDSFDLSLKEKKVLFTKTFNTFPINMYDDKPLTIDENDFEHRKCLKLIDKILLADDKNNSKIKTKKQNETKK